MVRPIFKNLKFYGNDNIMRTIVVNHPKCYLKNFQKDKMRGSFLKTRFMPESPFFLIFKNGVYLVAMAKKKCTA